MSDYLYYGEIVARISGTLNADPEKTATIHRMMRQQNQTDTIWTICADAGKVFNQLEDIAEEHFIDWQKAVDCYAHSIKHRFLIGNIPNKLDMLSLATNSIECAK